MAAVDDNSREIEWQDLADTVLVFVCTDTLDDIWPLIWFQDALFASFLSAFLVFLIPQLQPNSTDVAMDVLIHISQQLSNSTTPAFEPAAFQISSNAAVVNTLFFLSLALVLIDAFLAMLVKGWLQEYGHGSRKHTIAHLRAQERERRLRELERWNVDQIVGLLPTLIQGSLLMFCTGLIAILFPLHLPSAILCTIAFVSAVAIYLFTLFVPIFNEYSPFTSPMSRLLARVLAMPCLLACFLAKSRLLARFLAILKIPIIHTTSATRSHDRRPLHPQERQEGADTSSEATQPVPPNNGVAKRFFDDPQTHVYVLERLVSRTAEAADTIPIFLELLDQPVKYPTIRPFNLEKWKELLHITFGLLRGQPTFSASAAWTLARVMMICYNHKTADRQLRLTIQHHLRNREAGNQIPRMPLNMLYTSYLRSWFDPHRSNLWPTISLLEPSDAADTELFWMVNTFHRAIDHGAIQPEGRVRVHYAFFTAVLTYVSSTEQCRRSKVPLTAAVVYALHTIRSATHRDIDPLCILPGNVSISGSVPTMFCPAGGIDALDLWSEDGVQLVKDILQWFRGPSWDHDLQLSLIAALFLDTIEQAHARSTFANILEYTQITHIRSQYSDAYDHGKLAIYWYMALSQKPLDQDRDPSAALFDVIETTIAQHSTLRLPGLRILEIAVKHVHKTTPRSSDWLEKFSFGLRVISPDNPYRHPLFGVDHWVLLHLDTLLAPQPYLLPEEVKELKWSDTPEQVYIAEARLDSWVKAEHEGSAPNPELLRIFLWSKDIGVCTRAFKWSIELASTSPPGDGDSTEVFIPGTMGYQWVEHFVHVLCLADGGRAWELLKSHLVPNWPTPSRGAATGLLPSPWCFDFASAFLFSIYQPPDGDELPPHEFLGNSIGRMAIEEQQAYLHFLAIMLEHIKYSLSWDRVTSFGNWLAKLPRTFKNYNARIRFEDILATRKQQLAKEALSLFAELPMADS